MKMKLLLLALAALAAISNAYAQNRTVAYVDTLATLDARRPIPGETVYVRGGSAANDWGDTPLPFAYVSDSTAATNRFCRATATGVGRYIHQWDGDAAAFGISTNAADNGVLLTSANSLALDLNIPLTIPEGQYKLATWLVLSNNTHIRGKGIGRTVLLRNSSSAAQTNTHVQATLQTPGVFNPYLTNGGHGGDVTASVSNIVLEDFSISEAPGSYSGFPIALMAAEGSTIQRVHVYGVTNHWAITLHGNRLKAVDNRIDNTGRIYQDGIHFLGGRDSIISRNIIRSGDDAIAISSGGATDPNIRNIIVSDNSLYSSHGHALRVFQENASATNTFEGIRFVNNSGIGGFSRNGIIRFHSSSTNAVYPLKDISVSKAALQTGSESEHGSGLTNGAFGVFVEDCSGLRLENVTIGPTIWESLRIIDCEDTTLDNVVAVGATYSGFFNNTVRLENVGRLIVNSGDYRNIYNRGAQVFSLANVKSARFSGAFLSNTVAGGAVVGAFSNSAALAPGMISLIGNIVHSRSYVVLNSAYDSTNLVITGNEILSPNLALFANGTSVLPGNYIIEQNIGYDKGYFRSPRLQTTNSANLSQWFTDSSGYAVMMSTNGLIRFAQDELSAGSKSVRLAFQSISNNLPHLFVIHTDDGSFPYYRMGYGSSLNSSPRWWSFGNAGTNYTQGLETLRLDLPTTTGDLPLRVRIAGSNNVYRLRLSSSNTVPAGAKAVYID